MARSWYVSAMEGSLQYKERGGHGCCQSSDCEGGEEMQKREDRKKLMMVGGCEFNAA